MSISSLVVALCVLGVESEHASMGGIDLADQDTGDTAPVQADSILNAVSSAIDKRLRSPKLEWCNGLAALIFGLVMVIDGEFIFKAVVVTGIGIFVYLASSSGIKSHWPQVDNVIMEILAVEFALALSYVAYKGYEGVRVLLGMLLGLYGAQHLQAHLGQLAGNGWVVLVLGNIFVILGVYVFTGRMHKRIAAIVSSLVGGALVSSAIGYFIMLLLVKVRQNLFVGTTVPVWVDFLYTLVSPAKHSPVGIYSTPATKDLNPTIHGKQVFLDMILGMSLWFILTTVGIWNQLRLEKKARAKEDVQKKGDLEESLLPTNE